MGMAGQSRIEGAPMALQGGAGVYVAGRPQRLGQLAEVDVFGLQLARVISEMVHAQGACVLPVAGVGPAAGSALGTGSSR